MNERDVKTLLPALQAILFKQLDSRLERIEGKLDQKIADLSTEEAVDEYLAQHISRTKKPRNYHYLMLKFRECFAGANLPEVTAEEIEIFIEKNWDGPATRAQRAIQLRGFYEWVNKYLMKKGKPPFPNPMTLLEFPNHRKTPKYIPLEKVRSMLEAAETDRERLIVSILATTGMRAGELAKIAPGDVNGRVLTIRDPKSRRYNAPDDVSELAVLPKSVYLDLRAYMAAEKPEMAILGAYKGIYKVVARVAKRVGADITPHDLRRWCASFWDRRERWAMVQFVLRHRQGAHKGHGGDRLAAAHYVAPLTPKEAMKEQDIFMEEALFGETVGEEVNDG